MEETRTGSVGRDNAPGLEVRSPHRTQHALVDRNCNSTVGPSAGAVFGTDADVVLQAEISGPQKHRRAAPRGTTAGAVDPRATARCFAGHGEQKHVADLQAASTGCGPHRRRQAARKNRSRQLSSDDNRTPATARHVDRTDRKPRGHGQDLSRARGPRDAQPASGAASIRHAEIRSIASQPHARRSVAQGTGFHRAREIPRKRP